MIDHRKIVAGSRFQAHRIHGNHADRVGNIELGFRGTVRNSCYESFRDDQFSFKSSKVEEDGIEYHKCSPPLWKQNITTNESSPFLPSDHKYSSLSLPTRLQAIVEARKELMEMIRSMPENSYELSLTDLVDEQQTSREQNKEDSVVIEDEKISFRIEAGDQIKKKKKKKMMMTTNKSSGGQFSRSTSMNSGTFLIKIFCPSFIGSKRKSTNKNGSSKVSPRTSFEICKKKNDHDHHKLHWIKSIFVGGGNMGNGKNSCSSTKSDYNSTKRPVVTNYFFLGCCPFSRSRKSKATRQKGCFF